MLNFVLFWVCGLFDDIFVGVLKGYIDVVLDDEFLFLMFYEVLVKKMGDVIESICGIMVFF